MVMSVTFLLGRAGSGKTALIRERVARELAADPLGTPIVMLVPEQGSFEAERGLLSAAGVQGSVRAQTLSFSRLAYRVRQELGGSSRFPIGDEGKKMLIYKILGRRKEQLRLFGASAGRPGFVDRLERLHTELKRCCVGSSELEERLSSLGEGASYGPILKDKLEELALVFGDLDRELEPLYMDGEDRLAELAGLIPQSAYLRGAHIWVDGFHGFTPQEYLVLRALMNAAASVTVALTLDRPYDVQARPHELELFHMPAITYIKLRGMAEESGLTAADEVLNPPVPPRFAASPALAHLERGFDRKRPYRGDGCGEIAVHPAVSRRAEAEGALREIRRLAREQGVRYGEMAVLTRNPDDYAHLLPPLFADAGVPYFLDRKEELLHHPLVEFIRAAMDTVRRRWKYEDVFRCVKTELLLPQDGSVTRSDMDELENFVLACGIHGYRWTDGKPWKGIPSLSLESEDREDPALQERMERCREAVAAPLAAFEQRIRKSRTAADMSAAVYHLLDITDIPEKLEARSAGAAAGGRPAEAAEHRQLWGAVLDLLDQIVDMMGQERISFELFAGVLETGLAELRLGLVPPSLDQVLIGSMDRTRTANVRYAFLLGFNDGIVPAQFQEDGLLTEDERDRLEHAGLELAPGPTRRLLDERFLVYNALTSASGGLWISYAEADDEGKPLLPSEIIRHLERMFGTETAPLTGSLLTGQPQPGQPEEVQARFAAEPREALRSLFTQLRSWRQGGEMDDLWWDVYNWFVADETWRPELERRLGSLFYRNEGLRLNRSTSLRLYGGRTLKGSVSRMEKFASCAFAHYASYGLKLKERQLYKLKAPDIGQLFHASLNDIAMRLKEQGKGWGALTPEEARQEAGAAVDKLAPKLQGDILRSSKRYGYITRKLKTIVGRASAILGEHARRGSFEPVGLELDFGPGKDIPPLRVALPGGCTLEVAGRIDRVDAADSGNGLLLRVIDYKSSMKDLKLHEVYYGLSLQMLTYLDVLLDNAEAWLGRPALPGGTLYFHVHDPLLNSSNGMSREAAEQELLKRFKMRGMVLADREAVALMDGKLDKGYSQVLPVAVKSDGTFYSSSSVATPEQWNRLLASVRGTLTDIGTRITDGDVAIRPYRIQQETACTFCDFKPVCQFDEGLEGNSYNVLSKPAKGEVWDMLAGNTSHDEGGEG